MKEIHITSNEAGQRLDKLLAKYLREAPKSFLYKMMRKKNITLNGKKAQGNEQLSCGDCVRLFLADETIDKFRGSVPAPQMDKAVRSVTGKKGQARLDVIYEDDHIILINKPSGMLSQKAQPQDVSLVEYLTDYLLQTGSLTAEQLELFHPAVCNRLDRNTSGIVIAGKSLTGLQEMSRLLKERTVRKFYRCIVKGEMTGTHHLAGYLTKDQKTNTVTVTDCPHGRDDKRIETEYRTLAVSGGLSLLEVHLITGRSHQIRAHLASVGHPILGDMKYGDGALNQKYRASHGICAQMLHAYRLEFPEMKGELSYLSGRVFCAAMPPKYSAVAAWKGEL